ncbi:translation initiation factor IF-5A [Candidatus Woesearchaeota archaeon CG11_big_fil_rev_8_21_14_0_20_43_8]|nr:MAG: translation initiation factor IF-5A [Candidatus Woesearchaeota archaeon CG11_big_fil_rev_8_21_14_0_20_43_8]PIO05474.1 MAG: translation initiation factor IF-5A [Candidatus Woesearchaeota archaeon CG08_land_8_20_14_0_20_43_7]
MSKHVTATSAKPGTTIVIDGVACKVVDIKISRPGKHGHAKCNITAVGLLDDKKRNIIVPGHDQLEVPLIDKRNAQVLSVTGDMANVMDDETYETFDLKIPEELTGKVDSGATVLYWVILSERIMKQIKSEGS